MNICVYANGFRTLSIDGTSEALAQFGQILSELHSAPDGYLELATTPTDYGDMTAVELCMVERIPVICTRVYRGKPEPFLNQLVFPSVVRLGAFKCNVSPSACHWVSYALMPELKNSDGTSYRVSDILCKYCGRNVSPISYRDYRFLCSYPDSRYDCRTVEFDIDDFVRTARRRMRHDIELEGLCTIRAWRKGPSTAVMELTEAGIAELRDNCIDPLLSEPAQEFNHWHFYHLARVGKLDYTELVLLVANIEQYGKVKRGRQAVYDKYLHVSWATCMNLRCAYRFLTAEISWVAENPTYKDYRDIPIGNSSCPRCRSPFYISHRACYKSL